jgi:cysteine desulfurase family protein
VTGIYLDNAATTFPKPRQVGEALRDWLETGAGSPGRGNHAFALRSGDAVHRVRRGLARFFGVRDENRVVFCCSATDALNLALKGFLDEGDHVLISSMEHNSVLRPLRGLEQDRRIRLEVVPCDSLGRLDPGDIVSRFNERTRLVVVSHASNVAGTVQPIKEIGTAVRERGAYLLVDAAQSAGVLPLDLGALDVDMVAFAGHKGLYGLQGTGCLIVGDRVRSLRPWREGGTGVDSLSETQPRAWPEAFESGTPNVPGILSLGAGLAFVEEKGIDAIRGVEMERCSRIWEGLAGFDNVELYGPPPGEGRVGVLSLNIKGWEPEDVGDILNSNHGIRVRTGLHCAPLAHRTLGTHPLGTVRLSPGYFSTPDDIRKTVLAIGMLARTIVAG